MDELLEGRMRLDKVVNSELNAQFFAQIRNTLRLMFATAICEENERNVVIL